MYQSQLRGSSIFNDVNIDQVQSLSIEKTSSLSGEKLKENFLQGEIIV